MAEEDLELVVAEMITLLVKRLRSQRRQFFLDWLRDHLRAHVVEDEPLTDRLRMHLSGMPCEQVVREGIVIMREINWCERLEIWRLDELQNSH